MALSVRGISITLVQQSIGVSSDNVGELCISDKINMWSKRKPVSYPSIGGIYGAGGLDTSIIASVNYGLNIPIITAPSLINGETTTGVQAWGYNKPAGGANSPFRLGDFRGYNHSATNNLTIEMLNNKNNDNLLVVGDSDIGNYSTSYSVRIIEDASSEIKFSDLNMNSANIGNLSNLHLTLVIGSKLGTVMDSTHYKVYQAANNVNVDKNLVVDTSRLVYDNYLLSNTDVILAAVLMPKLEVGQQFKDCIPLRLNSNTKSIISAPYSVLFDGAGGGVRPISYITYLATWVGGMPPSVNHYGTNFDISFDMLNVEILNGSTSVQYDVKVDIQEINQTYTIGSGGGSSIIDTAVTYLSIPESLIIPNNIHYLTIRTYLVSKQIGYSFTTDTELVNTTDYIVY